jgi:hypothetical protein
VNKDDWPILAFLFAVLVMLLAAGWALWVDL